MALAWLSRKLEESEPWAWHFHAFVVNHAARPENRPDAKKTAMRVRDRLGEHASFSADDTC